MGCLALFDNPDPATSSGGDSIEQALAACFLPFPDDSATSLWVGLCRPALIEGNQSYLCLISNWSGLRESNPPGQLGRLLHKADMPSPQIWSPALPGNLAVPQEAPRYGGLKPRYACRLRKDRSLRKKKRTTYPGLFSAYPDNGYPCVSCRTPSIFGYTRLTPVTTGRLITPRKGVTAARNMPTVWMGSVSVPPETWLF